MRIGAVCLFALSLIAAPSVACSQTATILPAPAAAGMQRYEIDTDHSALEFRVGFMGVSSVHGDFASWEGTVMYDPAHVERMTATLVVAADSISTSVPARDRDLRSDHFFDVKKYPYITFSSSRMAPHGTGYTLTGDLTMHGVTKPVALELTQLHPLVKDAWQNQRLGFTGTTKLNRKDFGIEGIAFWNNEFDPGRRAIADSVDIDVTIEMELANMVTRTFPQAEGLVKRIDADGADAVVASVRPSAPDPHAPEFAAFRSMVVNAAAKLRQAGRFSAAAALYRMLAAVDPSDSKAFSGAGEMALFTGDKRRAAADFKHALGLDASNTVAAEYLRHL